MAILSKIKSAVSRLFSPKSTGITPPSSSNKNVASAFSAISSLAGGSKVSPTTATIQRTNAPQMTALPATATQTVNSILAGVTPQRTNAPQYSSAPQYTQDPTLPVYGTTSIRGGERPTAADMKITTDTNIISPQSVAYSAPSGVSGSLASPTTSSSAPSVGDQPTYSDPGLIDNTALIKELTSLFDYDTERRQFVPKAQGTSTQTDSIEETLKGFLPQKENLYEDSAIRAQEDEVRRRQQEVQGYTSQLNSIVAKQNADLLNLRGIGSQEGVTETVYGGQAATINREAAIRALPVQAQLASAQGNLQLAQDYLGQLTTWKKEEIDNNYEYKKGLYDLIRERVTGAEKRQLDKIEKDAEQKRKLQTDNLNFAQSIASEQFKPGGDRSVADRIMSLMQNPDDPRFMEKLGKETAKLGTSATGGKGVLATLPVSIQNRVISIAQKVGESTIGKKYTATVDSINVINGIDPKSKNPADHQAVVYNFAKALDPESVVREGEYATVKKYAQSAIDRYGKEISNAINGTGFLSEGAIKNIQTTMNNLFTSRKPQFDNLVAEQTKIINNIAGSDVASEIMVDYTGGITPTTSGVTVTTPAGVFTFPDSKAAEAFKKAAGLQ